MVYSWKMKTKKYQEKNFLRNSIPSPQSPAMVTVLYPTFNELSLNYLVHNLDLLQAQSHLELLFVDGGSTDGTLQLLQQRRVPLLICPHSSRSERFEQGLQKTTQPLVLFHHPRSQLSSEALQALKGLVPQPPLWGGFRHRFDRNSWLLRCTSWYANYVRARRGILYLDHCLFAHRQLMERIGGFPLLDIFEDTRLCEQLRLLSPPVILPFVTQTSAIRFNQNGLLWQSVMNQLLKLGYFLHIAHQPMNRFYEWGLELNQRHRKRRKF